MKTAMHGQCAFAALDHCHSRCVFEQCAEEMRLRVVVIMQCNMAGGISTGFKKRGMGFHTNGLSQ